MSTSKRQNALARVNALWVFMKAAPFWIVAEACGIPKDEVARLERKDLTLKDVERLWQSIWWLINEVRQHKEGKMLWNERTITNDDDLPFLGEEEETL